MMRLLTASPGGLLELRSFNDESCPPYAILSHTWTDGQEVTYDELLAGKSVDKSGYDKIRFCVNKAAEDGLQYSWVDTCCINKATSDELSTAINSMFRWYQRACKCYVYLSDVSTSIRASAMGTLQCSWEADFRKSRWFTRGWTLQELLAPASVEFFSKEGERLGSRASLEQLIHEITKIPVTVLRGQELAEVSIEEKMSWAASRTTTLKEDKVYCLLGIFGVFLPLIYGEGEEYATKRLNEEIEKRQEGRVAQRLPDLSVGALLPFSRNELFVGRRHHLQSLEEFLLPPNTHKRITIYGLGGCGKSALAIELAHRVLAREDGHLVFWVYAISQESFELAYRNIASTLRLPGFNDSKADIKEIVKKALSSDNMGEWLMIVDNADDRGVLMGDIGGPSKSTRLFDYLPHSNRGKIIFTTRSRKVAVDLTQSNILELTDMTRSEAREVLTKRISKPALLDDETAVDELLESLTYLPLAIVQATAFINNNEISVSRYTALFYEAGTEAELFGEPFEDPSRYGEMDNTIAKTFHISFDQIRKQDPLAAEYLSFMACTDRINIPLSLLPPADSTVQRYKAIGTLKGYAFITENRQDFHNSERETFFDIHRLVHMASIWWLDGHDEQAQWSAKAAARLIELIPQKNDFQDVRSAKKYLSHAIHLARSSSGLEDTEKEPLLDRISGSQFGLGQYSASERSLRDLLSLRTIILGMNHPMTLKSMSDLASVLTERGKYNEAEVVSGEALVKIKDVLGLDHRTTLKAMCHHSFLLMQQGRYEVAESINRETLTQYRRVVGLWHPETIYCMEVLAKILWRRGRFEEAESSWRQALTWRERVFGMKHMNTIRSMRDLVQVLISRGQLQEAEFMARRALAHSEESFQSEHPTTLTCMDGLGTTLLVQGRYQEAEELLWQTITQSEKVLGPEHPNTLHSVYALAELRTKQRRYEEADVMYARALTGLKSHFGDNHPTTLQCREGYSRMLAEKEQQGGLATAPQVRNNDGDKHSVLV